MKLVKINQNVAIDLDDIKEKKFGVKTCKFARLVCTQDFVCKGNFVKEGDKGAYVQVFVLDKKLLGGSIVVAIPRVKLYDSAWIDGSISWDIHSFARAGTVIGQGSYVGKNTNLAKNVNVGDNCKIDSGSIIGARTLVGNNTSCDRIICGKNVFIGENCLIGEKNLDGSLIGFTTYIGVPSDFLTRSWTAYQNRVYKQGTARLRANIKAKFIELKNQCQSLKRTVVGNNVFLSTDVTIETGASIGHNAKIGRFAKVKTFKNVPEGKVVENKEVVK